MVRGGKCQRCTVGTVDWKKQSSWCWTQVSMIVFLLTPPLQLTIPKVTIFHPPWLLVYGTIQASRDSISGETLKTHWGDDIFFCFGVLRFLKYTFVTLVYIAISRNMNSVSRMVLRSCFPSFLNLGVAICCYHRWWQARHRLQFQSLWA